MANLVMSEEAERAFLGALLTVCRVGGRVSPPEMSHLREVAGELARRIPVDDEWLLWSDVGPGELASAVLADTEGAYRSQGRSTGAEMATAFVAAALRVCGADGEPVESERKMIRKFGNALGLTDGQLDALGATSRNG